MSEHDLVTLYKHDNPEIGISLTAEETLASNLPLILVVGREPNNDGFFNDKFGTYNFDNAANCAFWNISHGVVAKIGGLDTATFKDACRKAGQSPVAFTDILPIAIPNDAANKAELRDEVEYPTIDKHIDNIIQLEPIIRRTKAVLLSGQRFGSVSGKGRDNMERGVRKLEQHLEDKDIPYLSVPFMYGTNQAKILELVKANKRVNTAIQNAHHDLIGLCA